MKQSTKDMKHKAILDLATEILAMKPTATLQEIADHANIGIATLHRHFATREGLLEELTLHAIQLMEEAFARITFDPHNLEGGLREALNALIPLGNKVYFLGSTAFRSDNPTVAEEAARVIRPLLQAIGEWKKSGLLSQDVPSKWMMVVMHHLLFVAWQEIQLGNIAKNDAAGFVLTTILNGFSSPRA